MKELSFRVKYGFNASDKEIIKEGELEKAIYAQVKGVPIKLGNSYINGRNIISITPNYHTFTGWNDWYEPQDAEDWKQIKRDCPSFDGVLDAYHERVKELISKGQDKLIGTLGKISVDETKRIEKNGLKSIGDLLK